jgi:hypothetical protein
MKGHQKESAQYSTKTSRKDRHDHMDARSSWWMVVIMDYDMAYNGRYNPGRSKKSRER